MTKRILRARRIADLRSLIGADASPQAFGVAGDGAVYAAVGSAREALTEGEPGGAIFPKSTLATGTDYDLLRVAGDVVTHARLRSEQVVASYVQPMPDGLLIAGARCHWQASGAERNALVVDWHGKVLRRLTLGDGIQDLRSTPNGTLWASYFDEGVFGNYGWNGPGPAGIGASGLVSFSAQGAVLSQYDSEAAGTDAICDAYALNVVDDREAWVCFYTEFPLVRMRDGKYRVWKCGERGARALAVREPRALLLGGYEERGRMRIVQMDLQGQARVIEEATVQADDDVSLDGALATGVGALLYLVADRRVFVVEDW